MEHVMEHTVLCIQAGDRATMEALWTQLQPEIWRQARHWARVLGKKRPHVTAEDLYQCGYIALDRAVREYVPQAGRSFLPGFGLCLRLEFARAAGHRAVRVLDAAEAGHGDISLAPTIEEALCALPEALRNVLKLRYLLGLSIQEAGMLLALTPEQAAEAEQRALALLRTGQQKQHLEAIYAGHSSSGPKQTFPHT